jgi:hypothetical protein
MEPLWSPVVATGGNPRQGLLPKRLKQAKTVAAACDQLPFGFHGKEGVDGSSPSEGSAKAPVIGAAAVELRDDVGGDDFELSERSPS